MTVDEYKRKIVDNAFEYIKCNAPYRWADLFDYICEHLDPNDSFDYVILEGAHRLGCETIEDAQKKADFDLELTHKVAEIVLQMFEENLRKGVY